MPLNERNQTKSKQGQLTTTDNRIKKKKEYEEKRINTR